MPDQTMTSQGMFSREEVISPDMAAYMLTKNAKNRPVMPRAVRRWARSIKGGDWFLSPQGIIFGKSGNLLDGQHRLMAIIETNATVPVYVTYNADDACYEILDTGNTRNFADRTGLPKRVAETLRTATELYMGDYGEAVTVKHARTLIPDAYLDIVRRLCFENQTTRKGISLSASMAAVAGRALQGEAEWVISSYYKMVQLKLEELDPAPRAHARAVVMGIPNKQRPQIFARMWNALSFEGRDRMKLPIRDAGQMIAEFRAVIDNFKEKNS